MLSEYRSLMQLQIVRHNDEDKIDIDLPYVGILHTTYKGSKDTEDGIEAVLDTDLELNKQFLIDYDNAKNEDPLLEKPLKTDLKSVVDVILGRK